MGPAFSDRVSLSLEHQSMNAPKDDPTLKIEEQKATFSIPLQEGFDSGWSFLGRGQRTVLGERLTFPDSGTRIPREFGSADFGFGWGSENPLRKIGVNATYGNAGTQLFSGKSSPVLNATIFYEQRRIDHSWLYFLNYANNRTILNNIPIPGIGYALNGKTHTAVFGLPFMFVSWRPDPISLAGAISPFGGSVDLGYRFWGPLQIFGNCSWSPKAYQNLVEGSDDRLIFDKKEAGGGLRVLLGAKANFSVAYVSSFDRKFMLGKSLTDRDAETLKIKDAEGFQIKGRVSF